MEEEVLVLWILLFFFVYTLETLPKKHDDEKAVIVISFFLQNLRQPYLDLIQIGIRTIKEKLFVLIG